jgi:glycosyltransferase involved in cell wall biosynthesis
MANVLSLVSYKIFPAKLGGQKGIALFNEYLSAFHQLICVTVIANDPSHASYKVLNILSDSRLRYINVFYFFTIKRIIKKYQISHLILEHPYYGWLAVWLKKFCNIKLIVHSHNIEAIRFKSVGKWWWRILWHYEKYIHQQADHSFCITEEDGQFMISHFNLNPEKCSVITYGIEWNEPPDAKEKTEAKIFLQNKYGLSQNTILYLFNGTLDYLPNLNAVKNILQNINPVVQSFNIDYRIIICGKNLPVEMNELQHYADKNIIYAGFVDDIRIYFRGVDIFINPLTDGGGIKTKLVEALGYDLNVISTINGAIGVNDQLCNGKLLLVADNNWKLFATKMLEATAISATIPEKYFDYFYWENIVKKAGDLIKN